MYLAGLYVIISASENYTKQLKIYQNFLDSGFASYNAMIKRGWGKLANEYRFTNSKKDRLKKYAKWWPKTDMPERIMDDVSNKRKSGYELRNALGTRSKRKLAEGEVYDKSLGCNSNVPLFSW